ncbi:MAG: tRNA-dihydrouridine synthase family protein [Treponema sp.]|nr:tRNA-dihydrouridine synthase family protein [Treponema sp.]
MKLICAPLAAISHPAFRVVLEQFGGCDEYFTEMIHAPSLVTGGQFERYYVDPQPAPQKIVWQLTGPDAPRLAAAAARVLLIGGIGVDINMGCAAPDIVRSGAGIAWMLKPRAETQAMLCAVRDAIREGESARCPLRFSVKLRLGEEHFSEHDFFSFCDMLADCGVQLLTLHPRTRKEKYRTKARWQYVEALAVRMHERGVRVYLNGDVSDYQSFYAAQSAAPHADGIMIGRAAVVRPWIFALLRAACGERVAMPLPSGDASSERAVLAVPAVRASDEPGAAPVQEYPGYKINLEQTAYLFIDALQQYQPEAFWKTRARRFFSYYCQNLSFAHYAETQFAHAHNMVDLRARIADYFIRVPEDREKSW